MDGILHKQGQSEQRQAVGNDACSRCLPGPTLASLLQVGQTSCPDHTALLCADQSFSFAELDRQSWQVFHFLRSQGLSRGDRVVVTAKKSWELVPIAVGIWRLGAIYVPLDAEYPVDRLRAVLTSIEPAFGFLTRSVMANHLSELSPIPHAALEAHVWSQEPQTGVCEGQANADDIAYIIHTSGSTGTPKGVAMSHRAIQAYFEGHNAHFNFGPGSVCLNNAPFHFDVSIQDVFLPLAFGAKVCLTPATPFPDLILDLMEKNRVTHLIIVASLLMMITENEETLLSRDFSELRVVMTGAELCKPSVLDFWRSLHPQMKVINGYGPTEVNSISLVYELAGHGRGRESAYPIGKPLKSVHAVLLDEQAVRIDQPGRDGELVLGGAQLMDGYWRNVEANKHAFINVDGQRYYRTGDICQLDANGDFVFVGRKDKEVKINGRRINIAEIEGRLIGTTGVKHAFASLLRHGDASHIVCSICMEAGINTDVLHAQVMTVLRRSFPAYMMPSFFGYFDHVAFGTTGKIKVSEQVSQLHAAIARDWQPVYRHSVDGFVVHRKQEALDHAE
ncbi:MAG: amino acid adenylation domain-containing protein [Moraxellaceae bacterium]|nr:amino acid adenylation domain-containing protein [Moraxellaceae bacterium]